MVNVCLYPLFHISFNMYSNVDFSKISEMDANKNVSIDVPASYTESLLWMDDKDQYWSSNSLQLHNWFNLTAPNKHK